MLLVCHGRLQSYLETTRRKGLRVVTLAMAKREERWRLPSRRGAIDQCAAVFHQRVSHEAKLGFLAPCLAIKLRLAFRVSPQRFRHSDSYLYSGAAFS